MSFSHSGPKDPIMTTHKPDPRSFGLSGRAFYGDRSEIRFQPEVKRGGEYGAATICSTFEPRLNRQTDSATCLDGSDSREPL